MELEEMIKVMENFKRDGEIEHREKWTNNEWEKSTTPTWDWKTYEYRIIEPKQIITIEKWLCLDNQGGFVVIETPNIEEYRYITEKVKLIESYEVEL